MRARSILIAACVAFATVSAGCKRLDDGTVDAGGPERREAKVYRVPIEGAPSLGESTALVTLVEFSDYECPFCAKVNVTVEKLRKTYGSKLRVVMQNLPLPMHTHARAAALGALAAGEQGRYWDMHERLFAQGRSLDSGRITELASELGLDLNLFAAAEACSNTKDALVRSENAAALLGVKATPTLFVNGRRLNGARPLDEIQKVVDEELERAEALVAGGVRPEDVYATTMKDAVLPEKGAALAKAPDGEGDEPHKGCDGEGDGPAIGTKVEEVSPSATRARGDERAPVTIVVFADFECPFCARVDATLKDLEASNRGKVRVSLRNRPLPMHPHAKLAAKASLAAGEQGKSWEYGDALYAHRDALDRASLERYARDLGLDTARFARDLDDPRLDAALASDDAEAARLDVTGTPTSFVNGHRVIGAQPLATFQTALDQALAHP